MIDLACGYKSLLMSGILDCGLAWPRDAGLELRLEGAGLSSTPDRLLGQGLSGTKSAWAATACPPSSSLLLPSCLSSSSLADPSSSPPAAPCCSSAWTPFNSKTAVYVARKKAICLSTFSAVLNPVRAVNVKRRTDVDSLMPHCC